MTLADVCTRRWILALVITFLVTSVSLFAQEVTTTSQPLTIQPGTVLTVRINEAVSSDRNQPGDVFSATLTQPVVVHGIVVAQRGQSVAGRVVAAQKAGKVTGLSRLTIKLTSLTLVDGQNVPLESQLVVRTGPTSTGSDAAGIATTTGLGAAIGGAADWGEGAAIGAGIGAVAGTVGVLLTRGHSTVIYPETLLTFQVTQPVTVHTDAAPDAFHAVDPEAYQQAQTEREEATAREVPPPPPYPPYTVYYPPPYYPYYSYPYYAPPYFYGPSFSLFFGFPSYYGYGRYYGHRHYYGYPHYYGPHYIAPRYYGPGHYRGDYGHVYGPRGNGPARPSAPHFRAPGGAHRGGWRR
jgi:hypothetical protein